MEKEEAEKWIQIYKDNWIDAHNTIIEINKIINDTLIFKEKHYRKIINKYLEKNRKSQ